jgi:O-acetyl-ADP-ribose deacetylase (regulator of RNase III)
MAAAAGNENPVRNTNLILMAIITLLKGDITLQHTDAIVNAANTSLLGGGGVDGAIHRAGGPAILEECIKIRNARGGCPTGKAVITTGGLLHARYVIHAVGPVWNGGGHGEKELLASAYHSALQVAVENDIGTIAFPNISTGIYGFPKPEAALIAIAAVTPFTAINTPLKEISFVCFDEENYAIYRQLLPNAEA